MNHCSHISTGGPTPTNAVTPADSWWCHIGGLGEIQENSLDDRAESLALCGAAGVGGGVRWALTPCGHQCQGAAEASPVSPKASGDCCRDAPDVCSKPKGGNSSAKKCLLNGQESSSCSECQTNKQKNCQSVVNSASTGSFLLAQAGSRRKVQEPRPGLRDFRTLLGTLCHCG